jgi:hypothetical protein
MFKMIYRAFYLGMTIAFVRRMCRKLIPDSRSRYYVLIPTSGIVYFVAGSYPDIAGCTRLSDALKANKWSSIVITGTRQVVGKYNIGRGLDRWTSQVQDGEFHSVFSDKLADHYFNDLVNELRGIARAHGQDVSSTTL